MTAREFLAEIERKRARIDNLRREINDLRESINLLPGVSYDGEKVQTSSTDDHVLRAIETLIDKERRLIRLIEEYEADRESRILTINLLADKDQCTLLYSRYVTGLYWWEIAKRMNRSERSVYAIHTAALEGLQAIMDKEVDDESNEERMDD